MGRDQIFNLWLGEFFLFQVVYLLIVLQVLLFCRAATFLAPVMWVLERIPLFAIIGCFTIWTFVSVFADF